MYLAIGILGFACLLGSLVLSLGGMVHVWNVPVSAIIILGSIGIALLLVSFTWAIVRFARTQADMYDHQFLLCPVCRYDLRSLAEEGRCPECGEPYRYVDLPRIWREENPVLGTPEHGHEGDAHDDETIAGAASSHGGIHRADMHRYLDVTNGSRNRKT